MCLVSFSKEKEYSSKKKFEKWDKKTPLWAYVELTDYCSHKCSWCYGSFPTKDKKFISLKDLKIVLDKLSTLGIMQLSIGGGEPTEHPEFIKVLKLISKYKMFKSKHLLTHGDNLDAGTLVEYGITSVHMNYQGSFKHEQVHKSSYQKQLNGIKSCLDNNIPLSASITVGAHNLKDVEAIVKECNDIGFERVRFWETTGVGVGQLKDNTVYDIFKACKEASFKYDYIYSHSYEPSYREADINVPCIQVSNLGMYIDYKARLKFCGATKDDIFISNIVVDEAEVILDKYLDFNKKFDCNKCEARRT